MALQIRLEYWIEQANSLEQALSIVKAAEVNRLMGLPAGEHDVELLGLYNDAWDLSSKLAQKLSVIQRKRSGT